MAPLIETLVRESIPETEFRKMIRVILYSELTVFISVVIFLFSLSGTSISDVVGQNLRDIIEVIGLKGRIGTDKSRVSMIP